jgi:hypothetical protein
MNYINDDKIGLIVKSAPSIAKCISVIRKYRPSPISEIKTNIETGKYVFDCGYTNTSGVRKVRRCYDELVKVGAIVEIYEHGDLTSREFISNLVDTYREIEEETNALIDEEAIKDE